MEQILDKKCEKIFQESFQTMTILKDIVDAQTKEQLLLNVLKEDYAAYLKRQSSKKEMLIGLTIS